jgi:hypothetical protein
MGRIGFLETPISINLKIEKKEFDFAKENDINLSEFLREQLKKINIINPIKKIEDLELTFKGKKEELDIKKKEIEKQIKVNQEEYKKELSVLKGEIKKDKEMPLNPTEINRLKEGRHFLEGKGTEEQFNFFYLSFLKSFPKRYYLSKPELLNYIKNRSK